MCQIKDCHVLMGCRVFLSQLSVIASLAAQYIALRGVWNKFGKFAWMENKRKTKKTVKKQKLYPLVLYPH